LPGALAFHSQPLSPEKSANELEGRSLTNAALKVFSGEKSASGAGRLADGEVGL